MKKYAELGFCGLSMDYEYGGSQLPLHTAFLARLPFLVANDQLAASCCRASSEFASLYDFCAAGSSLYGAEQDFPNLAKDAMFTTLANGINYGAVCLSGQAAAGDMAAVEGYALE